jgi:hypothetical protein
MSNKQPAKFFAGLNLLIAFREVIVKRHLLQQLQFRPLLFFV